MSIFFKKYNLVYYHGFTIFTILKSLYLIYQPVCLQKSCLYFFSFRNRFKISYSIKPLPQPFEQFLQGLNKLVGAQSLVRRSDTGSNKAHTSLKVLTSLFVSFLTNDLFTQFMKTFLEII